MENEGLQIVSEMPRPGAYPCDYNSIHFPPKLFSPTDVHIRRRFLASRINHFVNVFSLRPTHSL